MSLMLKTIKKCRIDRRYVRYIECGLDSSLTYEEIDDLEFLKNYGDVVVVDDVDYFVDEVCQISGAKTECIEIKIYRKSEV